MASDFTLSILGCGSAVPTPLHNPSCQILSRRGSLFMIDCGEGAQAMMRRMKIPFSRLRHIFISHLHGDHLLGLPGLLSTLALNDVQGTVTVHIFERGANMLRNVLNVISHDIPFNLEWNILDPDGGQLLVDAAGLTVSSFPLYHRVPCVGFRFTEQPKRRHLRGDMANFLGIPPYRREAIRLGADFVRPDGTVVPNEELTTPPDPSLSYAYCSDTMADSRIVPAIEGVTTLYHEATYGSELASKARERGHSTATEAGEIARLAGARNLIIGHYSKRYTDLTALAAEAREAFGGHVIAAAEGQTLDLATALPL